MNIRRRGKGDGFWAYYYSFEPTKCEPVDNILMAVAGAGASQHNTDMWTEEVGDEAPPVKSIQAVANESAATIADLKTECSELNEDLIRVMKERNEAEERVAQSVLKLVLPWVYNSDEEKLMEAKTEFFIKEWRQLWKEGRSK